MPTHRRTAVPRYGAETAAGPITAAVSIDVNAITHHAAEFMRLGCAGDYLSLGVLPKNSALKELTESMAAFAAVGRLLRATGCTKPHEVLTDPTVRLYDIGAGHAPRTAALFAMRTKWSTWAIDPALDLKWTDPDNLERKGLQRVAGVRARIEDCSLPVGPIGTAATHLTVLTLVHAHVTVVDALRALVLPSGEGMVHVIALPCCVPHDLPGLPPTLEYKDYGCLSPQRTVKAWALSWADVRRVTERQEVP